MLVGSNSTRRGATHRVLLLFLASVIVVLGLSYLGLRLRPADLRNESPESTVQVYCASGVATPVQQIVDAYNTQFGTYVRIVRTGGSGELAGQIKAEYATGLARGADIFISADDFLLAKAVQDGIIGPRFVLAEQRPVIAVRADSPVTVGSLQELLLDHEVRFGVASERAAIGKIVRQIARRDGLVDELELNKTTETENVMTLAQALVAGSLDAAVIWDTTVIQINQANHQRKDSQLRITADADPDRQSRSNIAMGVLTTTQNQPGCLQFANYLASSPTAKSTFVAFGYTFIGKPYAAASATGPPASMQTDPSSP